MKRLRRWATVLFVMAGLAQNCFGTAVVFVFNHGNIWIAADSLQSDRYNGKTRFACKILYSGNFYWAAAGPIYSDPTTGFEMSKLVDGFKSKPDGSLQTKMDEFADQSDEPIVRELAVMKKYAPARFADLLKSKVFLQVVFVGFENGKPTWVRGNFTAHDVEDQISITGIISVPNDSPDGGFYLLIGEAEEANNYLAAHKTELAADPAAILREAILVEEKAKPDYVGGDVSILRVSGSDREWIAQGGCAK